MIQRALALPGVSSRESRLANPAVNAIWIPDGLARGPRDAFIDGHEFCHLHPPPTGGIHLTLPESARQHVIEQGWAESHLISKGALLAPQLVLVYSPRNEEEVEVVLGLIDISYRFATGVW